MKRMLRRKFRAGATTVSRGNSTQTRHGVSVTSPTAPMRAVRSAASYT